MGTKIKPLESWDQEVSKSDISNLEDISASIDIRMNAAAAAFIDIGHLLNQARGMFKSDRTFGQWRIAQTPIRSQRTAHAYMQVARKFSAHSLVPKVSFSVLQELSSASDETIKEVEDKVDAGEPVKSKDVRAMKKGETPVLASEKAPSRPREDEDAAPVRPDPIRTAPAPKKEDVAPEEVFVMIAVTEDEGMRIVESLAICNHRELAKRIKEDIQ
jgi:hypothetical protein